MEIKIGDRTFQIPDACPTDGPNKRGLLVHPRDHGPESLLTSRKLAPYAQCILDEISNAGGEHMEPSEEPKTSAAAPLPTHKADLATGDNPAEAGPTS